MRPVHALVVLVVLVVLGRTTPVAAEAESSDLASTKPRVVETEPVPWYEGPNGKNRVLHLSIAAGAGLAFVATESLLKPTLAPDVCRWCDPTALDERIRNAVVWDDYDGARSFSNLTGYVAAPAFAIGISAVSALGSPDASWGRLIDDTVPILETVALSQVLTQAVKFAVGRQRPFVHYRSPPPDTDDNLSFYSGHAALTFSLATSAGMVAHWRKNRLEPVVWSVGYALAASTAYLRIAADKHYFTDVVVGSVVGVAAGIAIPQLMRRHSSIAIVPSRDGVAVAGAF